ncbi:MAG: hypothetical protein AAF739_03250 [Pseudomonadota bacterium]
MEVLARYLIEYGGVSGAALVAVLIGLALLVRSKGLVIFSSDVRTASTKRLNAVDGHLEQLTTDIGAVRQQVSAVDRRLGLVEQDLSTRPTADDFRRIELAVGRMDERQKAQGDKLSKVAGGVDRIETFLINLSKGSK